MRVDQSAQFANTVLKIEDGSLVPYRFPKFNYEEDQNQQADSPIEAQKPEVSSRSLDKSEKTEKKAGARQKLMIADRQVYRTYFNSIGRAHLVLFFAFGVAFAFTLRFPGSSGYHPLSPEKEAAYRFFYI